MCATLCRKTLIAPSAGVKLHGESMMSV
jgi:hypothetical protein